MARLLIVTRYYWPICNETSYYLTSLVGSLTRAGVDVSVLTARWHARWPAQSSLRESLVHRILPAPTSSWNEGHLVKNTWNWLERYADNYDAIYFDSCSLLGAGRLSSKLQQKPIFIRYDSYRYRNRKLATVPDSFKQLKNVRFIVQSAHEHRMAVASVIPEGKILRMPNLQWTTVARTDQAKSETFHALTQINFDFSVSPQLPLLVMFFEDKAVEQELEWTRTLARNFESLPPCRGWIFGSGESLRRHYSALNEYGCHHDILLHSSFDDLDAIYTVADMVICPADYVGDRFYYPSAIANGVPTALSEAEIADWDQKGCLMPANTRSVGSIMDSVASFLNQPDQAKRRSSELQRRTNWTAKYDESVQQWKEILETTEA